MNLSTARCNVRPFIEADIDAFMAYRNNMGWIKYQEFKGLTKQEYTKVLLENYFLTDGMQLAIICKQSNVLIGDLYLKQEGNICWIGYTITPQESRRGYIYEVVSAVICFLASQGTTCIKAGVTIGNDASVSLLKKLGFIFLNTKADEQIFLLEFISFA